jgi:Uma2 family endonuclease
MASSSSMNDKEGQAMAPAPPLMTLDTYLKTPETVKPMELARGVLRVADSPSAFHQAVVIELFRALDAHVRARDLGRVWVAPLDVVLSAEQAIVVQPDLFFVSAYSDFIVRDRVYGAPELVIEVLSPNPRIGSTEERLGWFAEFGVRECWLVDQSDATITIVRFDNRRIVARDRLLKCEEIESDVLPEFTLTLDEILSATPPSEPPEDLPPWRPSPEYKKPKR